MRLISIHPEPAKFIKQGLKKYEFRKLRARKVINKILREKYIAVYETAPVSAITMIFSVSKILIDAPSNLWSRFGRNAGVSKDYFMNYYGNRSMGSAIKIKKVFLLSEPIKLNKIKENYAEFNPPQNFYELSNEKYPRIYKKLLRYVK